MRARPPSSPRCSSATAPGSIARRPSACSRGASTTSSPSPGGNIAVLTAALLLVLRLAGAGGRPASLVSIGCLVAYAQVVAPEASVTRAVFVAVVFLAARAGRPPDGRPEHAGAGGGLPRGGGPALARRSRLPAHLRRHGGASGRGAEAHGPGRRRRRGQIGGGPVAPGSADGPVRGDHLRGARPVPDRRVPFFTGDRGRPGPQLRRHSADVGHPARRDGGGRPGAGQRGRRGGGRLDCACRRGRHRRVDARSGLGAVAVVAVAAAGAGSRCRLLRRVVPLSLRAPRIRITAPRRVASG